MAVTVLTPQRLTKNTFLADLVFTAPTTQADGFTIDPKQASDKTVLLVRNNNAGSQNVTLKAPVTTNKTSYSVTADQVQAYATLKLGAIVVDTTKWMGKDGLIRVVTGAVDTLLAWVELP